MLYEFFLSPDIFDINYYGRDNTDIDSRREICYTYLKELSKVVLEEGLLRDISNGKWGTYINRITNKHPETQYILKNLRKNKRIYFYKSSSNYDSSNCTEWCYKNWSEYTLKSHENSPLTGIIASRHIAKEINHPLIGAIDRLEKIDWWSSRSPSVRLMRTTDEYIKHLKLIFSHANSIMFIDPYINLTKYNYREFPRLINLIIQSNNCELVEIHVCQQFDNINNTSLEDYEQSFRDKLYPLLHQSDLKIEVFIWDHFHDRYLITDLLGINLNQGFDISNSNSSPEKTTWERLGISDRDDIQREFDPASNSHTLIKQFCIESI